MYLFGTKIGTAVWLVIGIGTGVLALRWNNQVTGIIAIGWIVLVVFSYLESRKSA